MSYVILLTPTWIVGSRLKSRARVVRVFISFGSGHIVDCVRWPQPSHNIRPLPMLFPRISPYAPTTRLLAPMNSQRFYFNMVISAITSATPATSQVGEGM